MRWAFVVFLTTLWCASRAVAATPVIRELEGKVARAPVAEKSAALVQLASALELVDPTRALETAQEARRSAQTPTDELRADAQRASVLRRRGDYAEAMSIAVAGLERASALRLDPQRLEFLFVIGQTHWSLAAYPAALETYQQVIELGEKLGNLTMVTRAENGIGIIYSEMNQHEQARFQFERALSLAERLQSAELRAWVLNNLGLYYSNVGNFTQARTTHEAALALRRAAFDTRGEADSLVNLGVASLQGGDAAAALTHTQRALALYEQLGLKRHIVNARRDAAAALRALGRLDESLAQLTTALALAESLGSQTVFANLYREFAATFEKRGDFKSALEYTRKLTTASESAHAETSRRRVDELQARFAAEKRQHEIALLRGEQAQREAELERARWQRYGLLAVLGLGGIALGAVISRQRLKLRTDQRILAEAQAARRAAEEADRVKTRFLGIASHDIRGPLGNIVNLAGTLRDEKPATAEQEVRSERLDLINSEAQRVLCLVEDLVTTAAMETGKLELRLAALDLEVVTRGAIESLRWQAEAKRQRIEFPPVSTGAGQTAGDAARLHQVVANLLGNAIKFGPPATTISVSLERVNHSIRLAVRDQGAGIAEADVQRLFTPFARLATQPTAGESSHGLGLSIAQEIVQLHGGQIRVESAPGLGSAFIVELPVAVAEEGGSTRSGLAVVRTG